MGVDTIPLTRLALAFVPVAVVIIIMWRWREAYGRALYAMARMLLQLLLIGYVLTYIFQAQSGWIILAVLTVMVLAASWIALNTIDRARGRFFPAALVAVASGGGATLFLITQAVLGLDPWYRPSYMVPLAGMVFAGSMTAISLAVDRLHAELDNGRPYATARAAAFRTAMIPVLNSLFAVGLIQLPGMMTGQILSGVSPVIAARYQIMVMCMLFSAAGLSTAVFLLQLERSGLPDRPDARGGDRE